MAGKSEYVCESCGIKFLQWPSQIAARTFCSRRCYARAQKGETPHNKGRRTVERKPCAQCGKAIIGEPSQVRRRKFCSRACTAEAFRGELVSTLARFTARSDGEGCWLWTAGTRNGYGRLKLAGHGSMEAHRISYELHVGPIPAGLQLDHLCRNRACVNPAHLEPVTLAENVRRGEAGKGPRSQAHREAISRAGKARFADPLEREAQAERLRRLRESPARLAAVREAVRSPAYRAAASERMKRIWAERRKGKA